MAAPNIVGVVTINGKTKGQAVTTSVADLLENVAASGKVFKIEHFCIANIDGTNNAEITINFYDASATTSYKLANTVVVPADASLLITDKPLYLEEGDKITVQANANSDLEATISWVEIS